VVRCTFRRRSVPGRGGTFRRRSSQAEVHFQTPQCPKQRWDFQTPQFPGSGGEVDFPHRSVPGRGVLPQCPRQSYTHFQTPPLRTEYTRASSFRWPIELEQCHSVSSQSTSVKLEQMQQCLLLPSHVIRSGTIQTSPSPPNVHLSSENIEGGVPLFASRRSRWVCSELAIGQPRQERILAKKSLNSSFPASWSLVQSPQAKLPHAA